MDNFCSRLSKILITGLNLASVRQRRLRFINFELQMNDSGGRMKTLWIEERRLKIV